MAKRKKKTKYADYFFSLLKVTGVLALLLICTYAIYENRKFFRRFYRKHIAHSKHIPFKAIDFPEGYSVHGIDISRYQDEVDWENLFTISTDGDTIPIRFAIIKATQGLLLEDPNFTEHWENAKEFGVVRGAYHYYLPDRSASIQAKNFISNVTLSKGDLPPVIDIEETRGKSKADMVKNLKVFALALEKEYGMKPIIYSNKTFISDYLVSDFKDYNFWIAHYYQEEINPPDSIKWVFWQHSDRCVLHNGYCNVDVNVFNGTMKELKSLTKK